MIIRSKAPLRLGIAGGGTDISPYCDKYGGVVLNATIDKYSYCTIQPTNDNKIQFISSDLEINYINDSIPHLDIDDILKLHKGTYNYIVKHYNNGQALSFKMTTYSDAPAGSGLGSSSTMVVGILKAYMEWLKLPIGEYDMAKIAHHIERVELGLAGGKQDQYAATFGGFNLIEFSENDRVIVNPLRIKNWIKNELESSVILYFLGTSRDSAKIINHQIESTKIEAALNAMHRVKAATFDMKEAILKGDFENFVLCMQETWKAKKETSSAISNDKIEETYDLVMKNGGRAAKISGAGGGGFMMIVCDPTARYNLMSILNKTDGQAMPVIFTERGTQAWTLY